MANLKTKKTAAGAQQYSSQGAAAKLKKSISKDIRSYIDGMMTSAEFKKKHGVSVGKAQNIVYAAAAAEKGDETDTKASKDVYNQHEKFLKDSKRSGMSKGGMAKKKMGYNKGGMCGASNPAARPMKKGK